MKKELWFEGRDHATLRDLKEGAIAVFAGCVLRQKTGGVSRYQGRSLPSIQTSNRLYLTLQVVGQQAKLTILRNEQTSRGDNRSL